LAQRTGHQEGNLLSGQGGGVGVEEAAVEELPPFPRELAIGHRTCKDDHVGSTHLIATSLINWTHSGFSVDVSVHIPAGSSKTRCPFGKRG